MKKFQIIVAFLVTFIGLSITSSVSAQNLTVPVTESTTSDTSELVVPENLNIGNFAIVPMMAQVTKVRIEAGAASKVSSGFYTELDVTGFDGIGEIAEKVRQIRIKLKIKNPQEQINVSAFLEDESGKALFSAYSGFTLDKVYDKDGNPSYQIPYGVVDLYFSPGNILVDFPGATGAYFVDQNGNQIPFTVVNEQIVARGWSIYGGYDYLVVKTSDGNEYLYDANTGQRLHGQPVEFDINNVFIDGVQVVQLDEGWLFVWLSPEYGYNPCIETNFSGSGQIILDIRSSYWEVAPLAVWMAQLDDLRKGYPPEVVQYSDGMIIEGTGTIYLFFEFPGWLNNVANNYGEKG